MNADASLGDDGIISDALVYGNIIHDNNGAAGINMDGLQNPTVFNNLIYNNHFSQGIALFQQDGAIVTQGGKIYNNTILVPADGRWGIHLTDGANIDTEIYNNIIINQHPWRGCITVEDTSQFTCDYNILNDKMSDQGDGATMSLSAWQALGFDSHSLVASSLEELFMDPVLFDLRLGDGSQAIDAGTDLVSSVVMVDLEGNPPPAGIQFDIGAYEKPSSVAITDVRIEGLAMTVSPNPAHHQVTVSGGPGTYNVSILSTQGQYIEQWRNVSLPYTVDIRSAPSGFLLLKWSIKGVGNPPPDL